MVADAEEGITFSDEVPGQLLMLWWKDPHSCPYEQAWLSPVGHKVKSETIPKVRKME